MLPALLTVMSIVTVMIVLFAVQQKWELRREGTGSPFCPVEMSDMKARMLAKHQQLDRLSTSLKNKDHITVSDLMTKKISTVPQDATLARVRELMTFHKTRHLLVQDSNELLVGIISDRDVGRHTSGTAKQVMTPDPATVAPDRPISEAVRMVLGKRVSCLPVVDGVKLCGVLTSTDLLLILECLVEDYEAAARQSMQVETSESPELASQTAGDATAV